jgi:hypothetical protein
MTGKKFVCPVCGREYEPEYENREDTPPRSIGREQHQTGICSDECWDEGLGIRADGGTEIPSVGARVEDRDGDGGSTAVVVNDHEEVPAFDVHIPAVNASVAAVNEDYPEDSCVLDVAFESDLDAALDVWESADAGALYDLCVNEAITMYSFPAGRLQR